MKVLVTGGSGLLGTSLVSTFSHSTDVSITYNSFQISVDNINSYKLNITDKDRVFNLIEKINPDIIIHTAALTNVEFCEKNPEMALNINVNGTKNISDACRKFDSKMIYISTDYVFDGQNGNYSEKDTPNPINYYGKTKLEGEHAVQKLDDNYLILRTSLYGWNIQNKLSFAEWIIDNLHQKKKINALTDQYSSLMFANHFSEVILKMINMDLYGLYNIASSEKNSKFIFARKLAEVFDLDETLIIPISTDELSKKIDQKAKRPKDVSLNVSKISKKIGPMPSIYFGLNNMKKVGNNYQKLNGS